jgi:dephospho-CoA kinase
MAAFVVAITGGIASGKSAVSALFESLGIVVADADAAARAVVAPGQPGLAEISERFGPDILLADNSLDRARLRARIFNDGDAKRDLEAITHPRIRQILRAQCQEAMSPYAIVAIPLLAETGSVAAYRWVQRILVVDTPIALQRARLIDRDGITPALAEQMIAAQANREQRLALATDVIVNDGDLGALEPMVRRLDHFYRERAAP